MDILNIHNDLLATEILSLLRPSGLMNFALSCKQFYEQRQFYLKSNKYIELYKLYDDNHSYMTVLFNSHIKIDSLADATITAFDLKDDLSVNMVVIKNTTKLIDFHLSKCVVVRRKHVLHDYYINMLTKQFGYVSSDYCNKMLQSIDGKWYACNVFLYDIYQLVYHVTKRNYRQVQTTLQNITFIRTSYPYYTLSLLLKLTNRIYNNTMMLVIIFVYYRYIEYVFEELKQGQKKDFILCLCDQAERFSYILLTNKQLPKYIKDMIQKQLQNVIVLGKSL